MQPKKRERFLNIRPTGHLISRHDGTRFGPVTLSIAEEVPIRKKNHAALFCMPMAVAVAIHEQQIMGRQYLQQGTNQKYGQN